LSGFDDPMEDIGLLSGPTMITQSEARLTSQRQQEAEGDGQRSDGLSEVNPG
jgi:hypothetical protein